MNILLTGCAGFIGSRTTKLTMLLILFAIIIGNVQAFSEPSSILVGDTLIVVTNRTEVQLKLEELNHLNANLNLKITNKNQFREKYNIQISLDKRVIWVWEWRENRYESNYLNAGEQINIPIEYKNLPIGRYKISIYINGEKLPAIETLFIIPVSEEQAKAEHILAIIIIVVALVAFIFILFFYRQSMEA